MTESPGRPQLEYRRIAEEIAARIESGSYAAGSKLPREQALAEEFGVAYGTIRRAMDVLRERGLIITAWGKGTFVREEEGR
jgi:DNA-binding GntR family transcriptional regulator